MSTIAEARYSTVAKPLVECLGGLDLVDKRLRHRRAGLVMPGELFEDFIGHHPVLVELGGQFHEIALNGRAGERGVGDVR